MAAIGIVENYSEHNKDQNEISINEEMNAKEKDLMEGENKGKNQNEANVEDKELREKSFYHSHNHEDLSNLKDLEGCSDSKINKIDSETRNENVSKDDNTPDMSEDTKIIESNSTKENFMEAILEEAKHVYEKSDEIIKKVKDSFANISKDSKDNIKEPTKFEDCQHEIITEKEKKDWSDLLAKVDVCENSSKDSDIEQISKQENSSKEIFQDNKRYKEVENKNEINKYNSEKPVGSDTDNSSKEKIYNPEISTSSSSIKDKIDNLRAKFISETESLYQKSEELLNKVFGATPKESEDNLIKSLKLEISVKEDKQPTNQDVDVIPLHKHEHRNNVETEPDPNLEETKDKPKETFETSIDEKTDEPLKKINESVLNETVKTVNNSNEN